MFAEARKLHIIEAVLKTTDEALLSAIETMVDTPSVTGNKENKFSDLLGSLSEKDAEKMKKTIEENFEKINPEDWK